jgi:hypothetical protein
MRLIKTISIAAIVSLASIGTTTAQVNDEIGYMAADIEAARTLMQTERKILIMREMTLTNDEASAFWPLYDEYNLEVKRVGDLRVKVITDYAVNYAKMTDELAKDLLDESIKYEEQRVKLKKKYVKKFRKILPETKVVRYFQLENKLNAIIDFRTAGEIPLMEGTEASAAP